MASKTSKPKNIKDRFSSTRWDIDNSLDIPDFNFDVPETKNDRNPVTKVGKSLLSGLKDSLFSKATLRSTIDRSLPREYGQALDLLDEGAGTVRSLYNTAADELRPAKNDLKNVARKILPGAEGKVPSRLLDLAKQWAKEGGKSDLSARRQREDSIAMELAGIFQAQAEDDNKRRKQDSTKEQFNQTLDQIRHRDQLGQLQSIRNSTERLATYQDKVLANFHRKSLELQFRQYHVSTDTLEAIKGGMAEQRQQLSGILKNTGLPDFVKLKETERFSEITRNKFMNDVRDSLFGGTSDYLRKFMGNVAKNAKGKIQDVAGQVNGLTSSLGMMGDADGMGMSKGQLAGQVAGGLVGDYAVGKGQDWLKGKIAGNPRLQKGAQKLKYGMNNPGHLMKDALSDPMRSWGPLEGFRAFLAESLPNTKADATLDKDTVGALGGVGIYTRGANKSITEIIPGYLSRILRELAIIRTGDISQPLSTYDFESNSFSNDKSVASKLIGKIASPFEKETVATRLDEAISMVDPEGKFSDDQRKAVRKQLLKLSIDSGNTDASALSNPMAWRDAGKGASGIASAFGSFLEADFDGKRAGTLSAIVNQNKVTDGVRDITSGLNDPRALLQAMMRNGQGDVLRQAGLLDKNGNVSTDGLADILLGNANPQGDVASGGARRMVGGRSTNKTTNVYNQQTTQNRTGSSFDLSGSKIPDNVQIMTDTLKQIHEQLAKGVLTYGTDISGYQGRLPGEFFGSNIPNSLKTGLEKLRTRWQDITLGDTLTGAKNAVTGLAGRAIGMAQAGFGTAMKFGKMGLATAGTFSGAALKKASDYFGDIYVGNEVGPRLTRARMQAGEYIDKASGKVITSLKDIKGEIVDKDGNIVLTLDDIKLAKLKGTASKMLTEVVKNVGTFTGSLAAGATKMLGGFYGTALNLGIAAFKAGIKMLPPFDVYVAGNKEPSLYAVKFRMGVYFHKDGGEAIRHPRDIKGPIVDENGNVVLSDEDIEKGLVDKNGIAIGNKIGRAVAKIKSVAGKAFGAIKGIVGSAKDLLVGLGNGLRDLFGGMFGLRGEFLTTSQSQLDIQTQILQVLKERLPKRKNVSGDADGDGVRDGSAEDLRRRAAAAAETKQEQVGGQATASNGGMGGIAGLLKGLAGKKDEEEDEDGDINIDLDGSDSDDKSKKKRKMRKPKAAPAKGFWGKAGQMAKGAGKGLWGAAKWGGKVGLGLAGLGVGGLATAGSLATGALGAVGTGLGFLGSAAAAVGAVLTSPVVLTGLAIAAAGYGLYKGYQWLTRAVPQTLSTVRLAQYGFDKTDVDRFRNILEVEALMEPHVTFKGQEATFDSSKVDMKKIFSIFGVKNPGDSQGRAFFQWFNARFKPIFFEHLNYLKGKHAGVIIGNVDDKLKPEEKKAYLDATALPGGPYDELTAPFEGMKTLAINGRGVAAVVELARTEIEKEISSAKTKPAGGAALAATATAATAVAVASGGDKKDAVVNGKPPEGSANLAQTVATQLGAGTKISLASTVPSEHIFTGDVGRMDALTTIRYKLYGLESMDAQKVRTLQQLELYVQASLKFGGVKVEFDDDIEIVLERIKGAFGITGARSERGYKWMTWFKCRFLPVFLNYATAMEKLTKKKDIVQAASALKAQDAISVANIINASSTVYDGSTVSVWKVKESPWRDAPMNMDPDTIEANMDNLTETAKSVIRGEQMSATVQKRVQSNEKTQVENNQAPARQASTSTPGGAAITYAKDPSTLNRDRAAANAQTAGSTIAPMRADGAGVRAQGDFVGGAPVSHPGKGSGGDINSIAAPKNGAGWASLKDTIIGAAGATGVDPKMLATIAAIESGFDPAARPGVNKATGKRASSAEGLFQFVAGTWNEQMRKNGAKYGIAPGTSASDPRANALLGGEYIKGNMQHLKKALGREVTATDVYLAHFLGPGGAVTFLKSDPNAIAADVMPDAAKANPSIFFDKGRPRTFAEIYKLMNDKVTGKLKQFGVSDSDFTGAGSAAGKPGAAPDAAAAAAAGGGGAPIAAPKGGLTLTLQRDKSTPGGTYGKLSLPDGTTFQTLELGWRGNASQKSCIPAGTYNVKTRKSAKYGDVYEVQNVPGRTAILIHAGNTAGDVDKGQKSDVQGCILLGMQRNETGGQPAISGSKQAMQQFASKMAGQAFTLNVQSAPGDNQAVDGQAVPQAKASEGGGASAPSAQTAPKAGGGGYGGSVASAAAGSSAGGGAAITSAASSSPQIVSGGGGATSASPPNPPAGSGTMPAAPGGSAPVPVTPGFGGFQPSSTPSASEIKAQETASRSEMGKEVTQISATLLTQLQETTAIKLFVGQIAEILMNKGEGGAKAPAGTNAQDTPQREAPRAPVSMSKG